MKRGSSNKKIDEDSIDNSHELGKAILKRSTLQVSWICSQALPINAITITLYVQGVQQVGATTNIIIWKCWNSMIQNH